MRVLKRETYNFNFLELLTKHPCSSSYKAIAQNGIYTSDSRSDSTCRTKLNDDDDDDDN